MKNVIALQKGTGWSHVQIDRVTKMQKSWKWDNGKYIEENRVDVYFGRLCNGNSDPVVIMNVYTQGAAAKEVVDDNCDVWKNIFTTTTVDDGNNFFKYLKKHGFKKVNF